MSGNGNTEKVDLQLLRKASGNACSLLNTLSNPDRLLLLCRLSQGELCVADLETETIKQPTLSQQLAILREERRVATRCQGKQIFYRLEGVEATAVMQVLFQLYCRTEKST